MNNELFDRMIKENLQEMQVTPSAGLKKALGWKLFFQNLLVFHKVKLIVGALLITGSSALYIASYGVSNESLIGSLILPNMGENNLVINNENVEHIVTNDLASNESNQVLNNNLTAKTVATESSEVKKNADEKTSAIDGNQKSNTNNNTSSVNDNANSSLSSNNAKNEEVNTPVLNDTESSLTEDVVNSSEVKTELPSEDVAEVMDTESEELGLQTMEAVEDVSLFLAESKGVDLASESILVSPLEGEDIELNMAPGVYQEWSFDVYKGIAGKSEIESILKTGAHQEYYWDFHGNNDVLDMNVLGGMNVNYTIGARVFRLKASTGVSYFTLNDTKAVYEFEEITDQAWLDYFDTDELAWVNTYGIDTCTQCFYAHNTEELQNELKKEYNQYSYVKVPLQLGAQLNFRRASLDVLGGLDMNFLTKSSGLYVKEGLNPDYERFYYWDNLQLSTLSKGNEMMRKSFMTWSVAANLRIRVSKNFDVLAGYQINKSLGSLTNDDYLMNKTLKTSNATIGITFYPFREAIKQKFVKE